MRLPTYDIPTGLYKTEHCGVTYYLPFELLETLKTYFAARRGTIAEWYSDLPAADKKKVERKGMPAPPAGDNFYPDTPAD